MYRRARRVAGRVVRGTRSRLGRPARVEGPAPLVSDAVALVFDPAYYRETYADIAESGADPLAHYAAHGRAELRRPGALFDPEWYLEQNADVAASGADPLDHFLLNGGAEGRDPIRAGFSSAWYLDQHPEVARSGANPLIHFLTEGAGLRYDPCPHFDTAWYLSHNPDVAAAGLNPLAHYLAHGAAEGRRPNGRGTNISGGQGEDSLSSSSVAGLLAQRHPDVRALRVIPGPDVPRINLVTDSIGADSLFGGVATAILLASLWADRTGRRLRVVTRHSAPDAAGLDQLFRTVGSRPHRQPELAFIPTGPGDYLEIGEDDLFLTTSWWTTASVLETVPAERVVYILQEDERCFYPVGTSSVAATATMNHPGIQVVVNTANLREHLVADGLDNLTSTAVTFEPSFAAFLRPGRRLGATRPRNLFFYSRPHNPRNLFELGLAALEGAIEQGALPRDRWRVHFAGKGVPPIDFCDGTRPVMHESLGWADYHELLGRIDLGVSLMASPHPSYPPLDLAASGAVVVTNTWTGKMDFAPVSDRVLTAEPTVESLTAAIVEAAATVDRLAGVPFEPAETPYFAEWSDNLGGVVEHLQRRFGDV